MKPFNLEEAKAGKPVCTRDGRDARIICFDAKDSETCKYKRPIVALITKIDGSEEDWFFYNDGLGNLNKSPSKYDLFMRPQKKKLWIGIEKAENSFGVHSTTVGFDDIKYLTLDNLDDYQIIEIEIDI